MVRRRGAMPCAVGVVGNPTAYTKQSFESDCNQLNGRIQVARLTRARPRHVAFTFLSHAARAPFGEVRALHCPALSAATRISSNASQYFFLCGELLKERQMAFRKRSISASSMSSRIRT